MMDRHFLRRHSRCMALAFSATVVSLLAACSSFSTYPPDGSGPRTYPWMAPGPEVMATGLMQAHARVAPDTPLVFNLPAGISQMAWDDVQRRLGPGARAMQPGDKVVWDLERYGISNTKAFTDIGYWNDGTAVLVTVSMERENILPFKVTHVQRWYVELNTPVCNNPAVKVDSGKAAPADASGAEDAAAEVAGSDS